MRLGVRSWDVLFFLVSGRAADVVRAALLPFFAFLPLQLLENLDGSVLAQSSARNNRHVTRCPSPSSASSRCLFGSRTVNNSIYSRPSYCAFSPVSNLAQSASSKQMATPHPLESSSDTQCDGQSSRTTLAGASSRGKGSFPHTLYGTDMETSRSMGARNGV